MKKVKMTGLVNCVKSAVTKRSPEILTGIGIAGMVTTTIFAVKATPKALMLIEEEKRRQNKELLEDAKKNGLDAYARIEKLKPVDVVKVTWKCYIPSALICVSSMACLIGASSVHLKRNAALATAYKLSETALTEYKDKVVETIGTKKEEAVRAAIAKDRIDKNPPVDREIIITGNGDTRCYDPLSSRYFDSDIETIRRSVNELNRRLLLEDYISLNEFYYELGLDPTEIGDTIGWRVDKGLVEIGFHAILDKKDKPCLALEYHIAPYHDYDK